MLFRKKTIVDEASEFQKQYSIAKIIIFKYLEVWFRQIFLLPEWKKLFEDKPRMPVIIAAEVERYLFGDDDKRNIDELTDKEAVRMGKKHAEKWADDAMNRDKDFCEFVIQTIRMDVIFRQFFEGTDWYRKDPRGLKISNILQKYGDKVKETPDPKKYKKLLAKWMLWDKLTSNKLNEK